MKQENGESPRTPLGKRNKMQDEMMDPNDPKSLKKRLTQLFSCVNDYKVCEPYLITINNVCFNILTVL